MRFEAVQFTTNNYGITTNSRTEYAFVASPDDVNPAGIGSSMPGYTERGWPEETSNVDGTTAQRRQKLKIIDPSSCPGAQASCPLRGRTQASHAAAGQPQGSSGGHSGGGLRGGPKPRTTMVITIVVHVATVSRGVKRND